MYWFDRSFRFDLPAALYPNVLERLRGTPCRLEERLLGVAAQRLIARPADGVWSAQENAGHLLDLEPLWLGRVEDFEAGRPELRPADLTNRATHEADHNRTAIADLLAAFRTARRELVDRLAAADDDLVRRQAKHPRLGQPMRLIDHAFFVAEHDDHHLARITRLLAEG